MGLAGALLLFAFYFLAIFAMMFLFKALNGRNIAREIPPAEGIEAAQSESVAAVRVHPYVAYAILGGIALLGVLVILS